MYMQLLLKQSCFILRLDTTEVNSPSKSLSLEATTNPYKRSSDLLLFYCPLKPQALWLTALNLTLERMCAARVLPELRP